MHHFGNKSTRYSLSMIANYGLIRSGNSLQKLEAREQRENKDRNSLKGTAN